MEMLHLTYGNADLHHKEGNILGDYQQETSFDTIYAARLFKEQIVKMIRQELKNLSYDKHVQAIVLDSTPNSDYANISLLSNLDATPIPILNVKKRDNVELRTGDEIYVEGINGTFTNMFIDFNKSMRTNSIQRIFNSTSSQQVTNSNVETTIIGIGIGSLYLPPGFLKVGKALKITVWGTHDATPTIGLDVKVKLDSQIVLDTSMNLDYLGTNNLFNIEALITCRTEGATGTLMGQGIFHHNEGAFYQTEFPMKMSVPLTIDTTVEHTLDITVKYDTISSLVQITSTNVLIELIN
jgi:hypothetical protein